MIQSFLLFVMALLCILIIISIIKSPFDVLKNPCKFKILAPKYLVEGNKKQAQFHIIVEKRHRYFINFPLLFKFYSKEKFKTSVNVSYKTLGDEAQPLLNKEIEFNSKVKEHIVYITNIIVGKITIEVLLEVEYGSPIIGFEIMQNNTCELMKEHKIELIFPE